MLFINMKVTETKILEELKKIKKNGKSAQERIRAQAILFSNDGKKSQEIADLFEVTRRTVFQWFKDFKSEGIESLKCSDGRGRKRLLNTDEHLKIVQKNIENCPHQPKKAFALTVEEIGIDMSYETFKRFLKKHSISATNE
jgi:transposase